MDQPLKGMSETSKVNLHEKLILSKILAMVVDFRVTRPKIIQNIKKKNERTRFKAKKGDKKAMVVTWSDSDSFESESEGKEIASFFFMAREHIEESQEFK